MRLLFVFVSLVVVCAAPRAGTAQAPAYLLIEASAGAGIGHLEGIVEAPARTPGGAWRIGVSTAPLRNAALYATYATTHFSCNVGVWCSDTTPTFAATGISFGGRLQFGALWVEGGGTFQHVETSWRHARAEAREKSDGRAGWEAAGGLRFLLGRTAAIVMGIRYARFEAEVGSRSLPYQVWHLAPQAGLRLKAF